MHSKKFFSKFNNIIFKNNVFSKKSFSSMNSSNAKSIFGYTTLGLATAGLGFLCMRNFSAASAEQKRLLLTQDTQKQQVINQRTRDTMVYFSSGLAITAFLTGAMARNPRIMAYSMSPFSLLLTLPSTLFCMYKMRTTPMENSSKNLWMLGFNASMAFNLCPIAGFIPLTVLRDAGILTSGLFTGLGLVAASSRDDAFLGMSGYLGAGLGCLIALSFANIFLNSPVIHNIWLYGGLLLFSGMTMYDIKEVQIRASKSAYFDPMSESISMYMDFINLFIRIALIMNNNKKK